MIRRSPPACGRVAPAEAAASARRVTIPGTMNVAVARLRTAASSTAAASNRGRMTWGRPMWMKWKCAKHPGAVHDLLHGQEPFGAVEAFPVVAAAVQLG